MTLEQMQQLVKRASDLMPGKPASDVLLTAAAMAEAVEAISPKVAESTDEAEARVTRKSLRDRGLDYASVANCAYDLVTVKGMTNAQAAKRMGASLRQVRGALNNYRLRNKTTK